jgi:transcriptional regulator with XRE-family HTH domain
MLGKHLKSLRVRLQETVADVSGAVEIDSELLLSIEDGSIKPSEDILLLLLSHLSVKEEEASKIWQLAGYEKNEFMPNDGFLDATAGAQPVVMVVPQDTRIQYTDQLNVTVNNYGVVLNFLQKNDGQGANAQPQLISRLGMSREHARSIIAVLQKTLDHSEQPPKSLPQNSTSPDRPAREN